jgi:hypothetical protein
MAALATLVALGPLGLRVPLLHVSKPFVPLDFGYLNVNEDEYAQFRKGSSAGRGLVGLLHVPRGESSAPVWAARMERVSPCYADRPRS